MKRVGPCKILAKYGANAYKVDLPNDLSISPIINVADLVKFKGPLIEMDRNNKEVGKDVEPDVLPPKMQLEVDKVLGSRVKKTTRHKVYMEHLIKWKHKPKSKATLSKGLNNYLKWLGHGCWIISVPTISFVCTTLNRNVPQPQIHSLTLSIRLPARMLEKTSCIVMGRTFP